MLSFQFNKLKNLKMNKLLVLGFMVISLSACSTKQETATELKSTFKNSAECQTLLKEIVKQHFNLRGIPTSALQFTVSAKSENEEQIQIDALKNEVSEAISIGKFKVLKSEKQIFDSTFGDTNMIKVDLKENKSVIDICFPQA